MLIRALHRGVDGCAVAVEPPRTPPATGWVWIDVTAGPDDMDELAVLAEELGLDAPAVRDTVQDVDLPKVDDFDSSVHVVLHALGKERIETFELGCFLSNGCLVTIHDQRSPSIDALWDGARRRPELAGGGADEALAETLDAYRGAEARQATDVTKVLTVYAAIMLPLTLIVGYFGMNFADLPLLDS